ncbi:MAG: hypothetical protein WAW61_10095, partial [Methylococcaceae bacterium]
MRLLILVLNLLIGSILLIQPAEILAATTASKNTHHRGYITSARGKAKAPRLHRTKQKKTTDSPGNVWERVRLGMQISQPNPQQKQPGQPIAQNKDGLPKISPRQTRLQMRSETHPQFHRLNDLILSEISTGRESVQPLQTLPKHSLVQKYNILSKPTGLQKRIHTNLSYYPYLQKPGSKISTKNFIGHGFSQIKPIRIDGYTNRQPIFTPAERSGQNLATSLKIIKNQGNIGEHSI